MKTKTKSLFKPYINVELSSLSYTYTYKYGSNCL